MPSAPERWAGEPLLRPDEEPSDVLAAGTARRQALDEALAEIDAGHDEPSYEWRVRFALMLGLERVLTGKPPQLASGTELRRHQVDALAGMLTALITANQREAEEANGFEALAGGEDEENGDLSAVRDENGQVDGRLDEEPEPAGEDPGAVRRYRFRHPTASGKTIAAAGFVEAARTAGVLILTHRRLLVSPVHPRADGGGLRRPPDARDPQRARSRRSRTRSRSRRTRGSPATRAT